MAASVANSMMQGSPPKAQAQANGSVTSALPSAPEPQIILEPKLCPGKCGFMVTFTHDTHCCTGCSRGQEHTNNCEGKPWKGVRSGDASPIKVAASCVESCCPCL